MSSDSPGHNLRSEAGAALVIVILLVSMLMVMVLAFFSLARIERRASHSYANTALVKVLESSATQLAIAQVSDATRNLGVDEAWASQPGMIRVYDGSGGMARSYKLYSAAEMVVTGRPDAAADAPPADWAERYGTWTDLNAPARKDPDNDEQADSWVFPIVDPRTDADGFAINNAPGATPEQEAPMPVRWLYMLKDGALAAPSDATGGKARIPAATGENPVVGRIAFWTDDESCKININTASEPTPWDTPRCASKDDLNYGKYQPYQGEFQRYPGHPYMTALSPVLFPGKDLISVPDKEAIYALLPRVAEGGTRGATVPYVAFDKGGAKHQPKADNERRYASVDELLFGPPREVEDKSLIDQERLRRAAFLLTAHSRAPELNLYGQPRISIWPVHSRAGDYRTIFDDLSVFCSTIGGKEYIFQRTDADSASAFVGTERNRRLYNYLAHLTGKNLPGVGGNYASKWSADHRQVLTEIADYIRCANLRDGTLKSDQRMFAGRSGQVTPMQVGNTMGFGRNHTLSEAGLHLICAGDGDDPKYTDVARRKNLPILKAGERLIESSLLFEGYSVTQGFYNLYGADFSKGGRKVLPKPHRQIFELTGLKSFKIEGQAMFKQDRITWSPPEGMGGSSTWGEKAWGGSLGVRSFVQNASYPLRGEKVRITGVTPDSKLNFSGGTVTVKITATGEDGRHREEVQTLEIKFPGSRFPMPRLVQRQNSRSQKGYSAPTDPDFWWDMRRRHSFIGKFPHTPGIEYPDLRRRWKSTAGITWGFMRGSPFRQEDVVRTVAPYHGDQRLVAATRKVGPQVFQPGYFYHDDEHFLDHTFAAPKGTQFIFGFSNEPGNRYIDGKERVVTLPSGSGMQLTDADYHFARMPDVPIGAGKYNKTGDFDNGSAHVVDGSYVNKPDDGNISEVEGYAYFHWAWKIPSQVIFSPNRLMPSPGMFGSLPTGVLRERPWETLLFRPQEDHPGAQDPKDHYLMDFFWMPVVEPYAISEPFSTGGKINMNYRLEPFPWIKRSTGLHAIFKSERPAAIPNTHTRGYKLFDQEIGDQWANKAAWPDSREWNMDYRRSGVQWRDLVKRSNFVRKDIDPEATLEQFEDHFDKGEVFVSASEICDIHLVRDDEDLSDYENGTFWKDHVVTGDNTRERPYTNMYGRLTTRSNVFRVHFRVEMLDMNTSTPDEFDPAAARVIASTRGSTLIERFIDPNDPALPDFTAPGVQERADEYFRWRIIERREFKP